ncbi:hypothetical protein M9H77_25085 [Catharanthus roseus]|uniref:Uncharacterized protein n=1 Tax=Catharanthus roseus TaxID=4058 RepID=A0ACC0A5X8_CATRO|nr:hypothetical protein M9H77_25085 [Catharanthus roseus]
MEEVPAYVHPSPILSLTHFSEYKVKKESLEAWISGEFTGSETDDDLIMRARRFIFLLLRAHKLPDMWALMRGNFRGYMTDKGIPCATSIWAWSRIIILRPQLDKHVEQDPRTLLCAMWCTLFDLSQLFTHVLLTYRDQLDFMSFDQFVWLPYPESGLVPSDLWRVEVPLMCYEIVKYHHSGCVM